MPHVRRLLLVLTMLATLAATGAGAASAAGTIVFDASPGSGPPPASLGPYAMTSFGRDPQPLFAPVAGVAGPGGTIAFSSELQHVRIGNGWATWSHGYAGDVYWTFGALAT